MKKKKKTICVKEQLAIEILAKVEESMDYYLGQERAFVEDDIKEILRDYNID